MIYFILFALLLGATCDAEDNDYEYASGEPVDGTSLETYRYYPQESADIESGSYQENDEPKKREVPITTAVPDGIKPSESVPIRKPTIPLADLINKVEGSIFQSALSVATSTKVLNTNSDSGSTKESTANQKRSASSADHLTSEKDTVFKYITARSIPAKDNQPPHYVVDEIEISNGPVALTPLISSLDFLVQPISESSVSTTADTPKHEIQRSDLTNAEATSSDIDVTMFVTPTHAAQVSATKSSVDDITTEEVKIALKSGSGSSTTASTSTSTTTSIPSTTTKTPIEKLKEAEDSLKEKVAEIEAEPVILSARV